jgi:uncharacterized protein YcaQ
MFYCGALVSGGRTNFKRIYALPEQVLPSALLENPPTVADAQKELLVKAAISLGVGTIKDMADYFRLKSKDVVTHFDELVEDGRLNQVAVEGWKEPAYVSPKADLNPMAHEGTTVLSPFDPICWNRDRTSRLFGFDYKIEIYVPAEKRKFGYYSLPVLHNGQLIARLDLKSNRQLNKLQVQSSWAEESQVGTFPTQEVSVHLNEVAKWQGLSSIEIAETGNISLELVTDLL